MERQYQARQPQFHGPPYVDRSSGVFHDLHRAWQSIDILKEKLCCTEKKLHTIDDRPLDLVTPTSGQFKNSSWKLSNSTGMRKRKVFRLGKESSVRPKPEIGEPPPFYPKTKKGVRWSTVAEKDEEESPSMAAPSGQFDRFGRGSTEPPGGHFLNTAAFDQFKRGDDEADLFLVPIRPLNDPVIQNGESFGQRSLQQNDRLTHVDVHLVRPPGDRLAPTPPASSPPVYWDRRSATALPSSTHARSIPPPEMMWVPIAPPSPRPKVDDHPGPNEALHLSPIWRTSKKRLTTPKLNSADRLTKLSADTTIVAVKTANTGKVMTRKKSRCISGNIQQSVINPYSWRRGQEVVVKELGPFVKPSPSNEPASVDLIIGKGEPENDSSSLLESVYQLPNDSDKEQRENVKRGDDPGGSLKNLPGEMRNSPHSSSTLSQPKKGSRHSKHNTKSSGKMAAKKPSRFKRNPAEDEVKESTLKVRHYDAVSIRKYIKEQQENRKRKMKEEAISSRSSKEQQRQKLEDLRTRQKVLASMVPPIAKNPQATKVTGAREERQWNDENGSKARDQDKGLAFQPSEQDYIWDRVLYLSNLPVPRRSSSKSSKGRKPLSLTSENLSAETNNLSEIEAHQSPFTNLDPKAHGDGGGRVTANERLQSLSTLYGNQVDFATKEIQTSNEKRSKLMSLQRQACRLQERIDEETMRVTAKFHPQFEAPINGHAGGEGCSDALNGLNMAQLVSKHAIKGEESSENGNRNSDTSLSEGSLRSGKRQWSTRNRSLDGVHRRIAINTIIAKSELCINQSEVGKVTERDWRLLIPRETPDPYNFFSALQRKQETSQPAAQNAEETQDSRTVAVVIPEIAPAESDHPAPSSYFHPLSLALTTSKDSKQERHQSKPTVESPDTTVASLVNNESEVAMSPDSSISLSQHMLTSGLVHSDTDDRLSEGTLESISDVYHTQEAAPLHNRADEQLIESQQEIKDMEMPTNERISIQSEQHMSIESLTRDSISLTPQSRLHSGELNSTSLKMSPNTLHLRMATELSFLENVQASLGQLQDLEKIRSISIAQQELEQVIQVKQSERSGTIEMNKPLDEATGSSLHLSTIQLLKSQAEVTRISAEATKQLTEISKTIMKQHSRQAASSQTTEAVAAATAAAVTAALSQLKQTLQQQKARSYRQDSSNALRSPQQSSSGEAATEDSTSFSSGNSQTREEERASKDSSMRKTNGSSNNSQQREILKNIGMEDDDRTSEGSAITAKEHQVEEERSYRMLLPSESHRRSSLGSQMQRMASPVSDLSKNSSISEVLSVGSEVPTSPTNAGGAGLFSGENSFQRFTLGMVKQYMEEEGMRTHHQKAITQLQEEASLRQTKDEMAWNKLHRKQNRVKGEDDRMPTTDSKKCKSTSGRHVKADLKTNDKIDRKTQDDVPLQGNRGVIEQLPNLKSSSEIVLSNAKIKNDNGLQHSDPISSVTDQFSSSDIKSELSASTQEEESEAQVAAKSNNNGKSKMLALPSSPSTTRVLQGLKKLQVSKRYLTKREQKLLQRRKNVEELLRWQRELDQEELKVQEMEQKALEILGDKRQAAISESIREKDETVSSRTQEISTKLSLTQSSQHESVVEQLTGGQPSETSLPEELSSMESSTNVTSGNASDVTVTKLEESPKASTSISGESVTAYSKETFEKLSTSASKMETGSNNAAVFATSVFATGTGKGSPQSSPKSKSIVLRSPLTPIRTLARKRCDSSGSEDSCTISQSETASEPSDIEGRIHALKKDLRQRKSEAERLKKEQKRKNVERLKEQEASLLKQIEAYDRYIYQAKLDLQKELEQDGGSKVSVKPVIMQPKVAESKRLQRQSALDKSPEQDDKKISTILKERKEITADSPRSLDNDPASGQVLREVVESGEDSYETIKTTSSVDEFLPLEASKGSDEDGSKGTVVIESGSAAEENNLEGSKEEDSTERERSLDDITVPAPKTAIENVPDDQDTDQSNIPTIDDDLDNSSLDEEDVKSDYSIQRKTSFDFEMVVQEERSVEDAAGQPQSQPELEDHRVNDVNLIEVVVSKNDTKSEVLADEITNYLMNRMLSDVTELLKVQTTKVDREEKHLRGQLKEVNEMSREKELVVTTESASVSHLDPCVGQQIADRLLLNLLDEAFMVSLRVRSGTRARGSMSDCATRTVEESGETKCASSHCSKGKPMQKSSVYERVSSIMAEISEKQSSIGTGTRQQDLLVLSFNEDLPSFASQAAPHKISDLALKSDPSSPVRRPSSPVFGEPGELSPLDLEARLLSLQAAEGLVLDPDDLLTSQEWFEDDFGLAGGSAMTSSPVQHYQIYPYQDSYYIREIPNKPPPPYTPPGKASLATPPATLLSPLTQFDPKRLAADLFRTVSYDDGDIREQVAKAAEFFYRRATGSEYGEPPDASFSGHDRDDDIDDRSRKVYERFLTKLTQEIVEGIYEHKAPERPLWLKPEWPTRTRTALLPKSSVELVSAVQTRALDLLSDSKGERAQVSSHLLKWGRKKRDIVDEILLQELRKEEADWVTYDVDEVAVKNQLTDAIFDQLIDQLVQDVTDVYSKKKNER